MNLWTRSFYEDALENVSHWINFYVADATFLLKGFGLDGSELFEEIVRVLFVIEEKEESVDDVIDFIDKVVKDPEAGSWSYSGL